MKKYNILVSALGLSLLLCGCNYNDIAAPPSQNNQININPNAKVVTIAALKAMYQGKPLEIDQDIVVEGLVASDDSEGNFYKTMVVEDSTAGIEVKLGMGNLSTLYSQGSKVRIKCMGMTLGTYGDQVNLGYRSANPKYETAFYPEKLIPYAVMKISDPGLQPKVVTLNDISPKMSGMLIQLNDVEFSSSDLGKTFADVNNKTSAQNRTLVDAKGKQIVVRTSGYAKFAGTPIPEGSGSVVAVLTYFRTTPQLTICRIKDVELNKPRF